ncbi:hypothetical protein DITRI_Ditri17bG0062200 [Diplodiscus trichospermus]
MDTGAAGSSSRISRTHLERERRMRFRDLFFQLSCLLRPQPPKMSNPQLLDQTIVYVNQLRNRVEELKLQIEEECRQMTSGRSVISPVINITKLNSIVEVNLITGCDGKFRLCDIIKIRMEEGAEVITAAANCNAGDRIIYSIHCQAISSRIGIATSRVQERLEDLIS